VQLLNDPARRRRLGDAGFARVTEQFTVERMVTATANAYTDVRRWNAD
jgi:glycosyltransferase involved in cell wall biosynthesis